MNKRRLGAVVLGVLAAGGLAVGGVMMAGSDSGSGKPKTLTAGGAIADPASDVDLDGVPADAAPSQADITNVSAEYTPDGLVLKVGVRKPMDPMVDPNWSSDSTFLSWEVDTTGDGRDDYEISYYAKDGLFYGDVSKSGESQATCPLKDAKFDDTGYTAIVNPECMGNPATVSYRAILFYDTDPQSDAPSVSDTAPDQGMLGPITAPPASTTSSTR